MPCIRGKKIAWEEADILFEFAAQEVGRSIISGQIKVLDFLLHDPVGHRIDIETDYVAADAVRFQERSAAPINGSAILTFGKSFGL